MPYCLYYQATLERTKTWFVTGCLRNDDHITFDRALNQKSGLFEFFVPADQNKSFLYLMKKFEQMGLVTNLVQLPNRLEQDPTAPLNPYR